MKIKTLIITFLFFGFTLSTLAQFLDTYQLSFTASYEEEHRVIDSILIMNLTQETDTMLYAPDTVLLLDCFDIGTTIEHPQSNPNSFSISPNYPNPFRNQTHVDISIENAGKVLIRIFDLLGREHAYFENVLDAGIHTFSFYPGAENVYIFSATYGGLTKGTKIINPLSAQKKCEISYKSYKDLTADSKDHPLSYFHMHINDTLRFIGYSSIPMIFPIKGSHVIEHVPTSDSSFVFNLISGVPCIDIPFVYYDEVTYNTLQIGPQCWFKQNLNYGTMVPGTTEMTHNMIREKYCYNDQPVICERLGALYQWGEAMNYSILSGAQGICPPGWHIPTDEEFKQLEGTVDSQYGYPDTTWDALGYRGYDVGKRLKSASEWESGYSTNHYGFSALGTGCRFVDSTFMNMRRYTSLWTSTSVSPMFSHYRYMEDWQIKVCRTSAPNNMGRSVRCLRNE